MDVSVCLIACPSSRSKDIVEPLQLYVKCDEMAAKAVEVRWGCG